MTVTAEPSSPSKSIYELTLLDGNLSSRANLQFVLFFQTSGGISHETSKKLRAAFFEALSRYPILYGRIERTADQNGKEKAHVVCEHGTAEHQISYKEYMVNELVEDIQLANYNWATWPAPLLSICPIRRAANGMRSESPLVQCVITRHTDGMGILLSVDHSIVDGIGIEILLKQWAGIARNSTSRNPQQPPLPVDFDHKSLYEKLRTETPEDDWFVQHVDAVDLDKAPKESGAILDSDPREPHQVEFAMRANVRGLRMTPESLKRLYQDSTSNSEAGVDHPTHVPVIRLAYALVWQRYMAALSADDNNEQSQQDGEAVHSPQCFLNVIHSARHLVDRPHYIGNTVCPVYMQQKAPELQKMSVSQLAAQIGQHMHAVTRPRWLGSMLMLQDTRRYHKFLTVFASPSAKQLTVSNISRLGFFDVDFGFGPPAHVTVYPALIPGFATWLPLGVSGGLHILWNMSDLAATHLRSDPLFTRYVDFLF